jgi:hypothetical protein
MLQRENKLLNYPGCEHAECPDKTESGQEQDKDGDNKGRPILIF